MPIDLQIVGKELEPLECNIEKRDVMLYARGVGAGEDREDLKYVYEGQLEALPTFGVIPPFPSLTGFAGMDGVEINLAMLLHGQQYLEVKKHPTPVQGKLISRPRVANVFDKGKGALVELEVNTEDEKGEVVFFNRFGAFVRGEGGFGGEKGLDPGYEPPERGPDRVVEMKTLPQQALIYRLSGDYNPLHADPEFAAMAGFDSPILHGLCSFGFAGRAVLKEFCGNDPTRFQAIQVRFSRHVFPGETLVTEMWEVDPSQIIFRTKVAERDEYCITNAAAWILPGS